MFRAGVFCAKTAENRDNLEVGRCDVFQRRVWICRVSVYVCMLMIFFSQWGGSDFEMNSQQLMDTNSGDLEYQGD